jgi:uncharacterized membrane protein
MIELAHPWFLALAGAAAVWLWLAQRRSLADLTPAQRRVCTMVRGLILLLLVLALAGLRLLLPSREVAVLFAIDQSASISPAAQEQARAFVAESLGSQHGSDVAGVIGFAAEPQILEAPLERLRLAESWPAPANRASTETARALEFASALFPVEKTRRLVLLSDGNDTSGNLTAAAQRLAANGVELFTVPLRNASAPEVLVEKVNIPQRLKSGEPFDLTATIRSSGATKAKIKLYQNQFLVSEQERELAAGTNEFRAPNLKAEGSFASYEVEVIPDSDTILENNRAQATAALRGEPRVLIVDTDEARARPLADALRSAKITVEARGTVGLPRSLEDLQQFDLFMLSDVSALQLGRETMELYRRWVQDFGGGFVMLGGENSFGVGGYYRTPIEQMLPVRMEHEDRQDTPSVALLIVLDRSGSMNAQVEGQTKMALANQGAALALNVLQPKDYFGVLAVDVRSHTIAPLQQHPSKSPVEQKILAITAGGGGIYIYTSLAEAFQLLRDNPARIKHVILFSDAADAEEKNAGEIGETGRGGGSSLDLASAMVSAKITTSIVALGAASDKDTTFLRQLADRGNGRFYLTNDATSLPQIFSTETMKVTQSSLVEEPFLAAPATASALTASINWAEAPLLLGYNTTRSKPTAELLLATERGEPLLATWRYGLGQAAAFTSDAKSRWASEWLSWPGYGQFWAQVVRGLMRKSDAGSFQVTTEESADRLTLTIDAVQPDGSFRNQLPITVNAVGANQQTVTKPAVQVGPGRYAVSFDLPELGTTIFNVSSPDLPDGGHIFGRTRSYPREFLSTETNEPLLRQIAGSPARYEPAPKALFARPDQSTLQRRDLTDWFLIAALLLFPLDIWLRRRTWATP